MPRRPKRDSAPIDHGRVVDSFGELRDRTHYQAFEANCARCGARFEMTATAQQHVHERLGVPITRARAAGSCSRCRTAVGQAKRARAGHDSLVHAAERARVAANAQPMHGGLLLEYVVAKLRVLEQSWSARSAERLLGELRRVAKLDPSLTKLASKREVQLREAIERRRAAEPS